MGLEKKESSIGSWDEVWNAYDREIYEYHLALEQHRVRWRRIEQIVLDKFGSFSGLNCIEIGAGSGHYSMLFARRGAKVTLIDYSKESSEFCKTIFNDQGFTSDQVKFVLMDALKLDSLFLGKFDVSMSFGVAEHFKGNDRKAIVKNHLKVLKNGGLALINVPNKACIPLRILQILMKYFRKNNMEAYYFTRSELANIVKEYDRATNYYYIGSSIYETYSPLSYYRRKKAIIRDITCLRKERATFLDQYMGRDITLIATAGGKE